MPSMLMVSIGLLAANYGDADVQDFQLKVEDLVNQAAGWIFGILGTLLVLWGIYIGIKWASARRAEQYQEAKDMLKRFFIGLILMVVVGVAAGIILGVVKGAFNV